MKFNGCLVLLFLVSNLAMAETATLPPQEMNVLEMEESANSVTVAIDIRDSYVPRPIDPQPLQLDQPPDDPGIWTYRSLFGAGVVSGLGLGIWGIYSSFDSLQSGYQSRGVYQGMVISAGGLILTGVFTLLLDGVIPE